MQVFDPILDTIRHALPEVPREAIVASAPPKLALGDLAVPMFQAAKALGVAPPALANDVAAKTPTSAEIRELRPAGPFLNIRLDRGHVAKRLVEAIRKAGDRFGSGQTGTGKSALLEHTSINPNASPHVGRARNALIGDSVARLLRFEGFDVDVHYYVNDMGRQIGLLVLIAEELEDLSFDAVLDAYVQANARAESDPAFAESGYALLAKMEAGDAETVAKFRTVVERCLHGQLAVLERVGARYDSFDWESGYLSDRRMEALEAALRERDVLFVDDEHRLVADLRKLGYEPDEGRYFVLRRANGSSMYGYRDLAYTMDKLANGADLDLIVLGEDHKLYAQQLALLLSAGGHKSPESIYYSYITLKSGKMSTRRGTVVLLAELLDQAHELALERVREQCLDLDAAEQATIAEQVAVGAMRFAILRVSATKNITFDVEASLSFQGDTGPYIQYCCARIQSILRKHGEALGDPPTDFATDSDAEWGLVLKLASFDEAVRAAVGQRSVAPVVTYALDLARTYTSFYHDCPVLTAETPALKLARLHLCASTLRVLRNALGLAGIPVPERM